MKTTTLIAALAVLLTGCATPALHGIPEERRVELPDEFLGEWVDSDEQEETTLLVERRSNGRCEVLARFQDEGRDLVELRLEVSAVLLVGQHVLDVALAEDEFEGLFEKYGTLVIPAHVYCRLQGGGKDITLTFLEPDWLKGHAQVESIESIGDTQLVTASAGELVELLTAAASDETAWEAQWTLTRRL